jgi:phosphatidylserine/phosphatidylglycerophosphate/cardiolipin synthase-like enzyme
MSLHPMSLHQVPTADLQDLLAGLRSQRFGCPLTQTQLSSSFGARAQYFTALFGKPEEIVTEVLVFVLAERTERAKRDLELVWTGPEAKAGTTRDSEMVLRELFRTAARTVLLAGYSFGKKGGVLQELFFAMRDRKVTARVILDLDQVQKRKPYHVDLLAYAEDTARLFYREHWGYGAPMPELYMDARMLRDDAWGADQNQPFPLLSMHAKCAVVDTRDVLITSANFTPRAQERNIELGVRVQEAAFAKQIEAQFHTLIDSGALQQIGK